MLYFVTTIRVLTLQKIHWNIRTVLTRYNAIIS